MSLKVGSLVEMCERFAHSEDKDARVIGEFKIEGETKEFWLVGPSGRRFHKQTLRLVPRYLTYVHFIRVKPCP